MFPLNYPRYKIKVPNTKNIVPIILNFTFSLKIKYANKIETKIEIIDKGSAMLISIYLKAFNKAI